jgi:hypothetical protein
MIPKRCWVLAAVLLSAAGTQAFADVLTWSGPNGATWGGYYTSPYTAKDVTRNELLTIFCLDFNNEIAPPTTWEANLVDLSGSNVGQYQYGGSYGVPAPSQPPPFRSVGLFTTTTYDDAINRYRAAAWLFTNILNSPPYSSNSAIVSQVAAWELFVSAGNLGTLTTKINGTSGTWTFNDNVGSGLPTTGTFATAVDAALNAAHAAVYDNGWTGAGAWQVVTADATWVNTTHSGIRVQEFLTPVPEPASLALFGSLVVAGVAARRKWLARSR